MQYLGYEVHGHGRPLVLLHGWCCDSRFMLPIARMFPQREVWLIDLPGYGHSRLLKDLGSDFKLTVKALLNTLPEDCDLMAWSLGSLYAISACASPGCRAVSLITICGSPYFPAADQWPGLNRLLIEKCRRLIRRDQCGRLLKFFLKLQAVNLYSADYAYMKSAVNEADADHEVLQQGIDLIFKADLRDDNRYLSLPCLNLFGAKDRLVPPQLADLMPKGPMRKTYIFPYSAHTPYLTEQAAFCSVTANFMERVQALRA